MGVIVQPSSELLRAPELLLPMRKPIGPVKVDYSNPIAQGIYAYFMVTESSGLTVHDNLISGTEGDLSFGITDASFVQDPDDRPLRNNVIQLANGKTVSFNSTLLALFDRLSVPRGSVSFWFRRTFLDSVSGWPTPFRIDGSTTQVQFFWHNTNNNWTFNIYGGAKNNIPATAFTRDVWTNGIITWDTDTDEGKAYANGELLLTESSATTTPTTLTKIELNNTANDETEGEFTDIIFWGGKVLSDVEVLSLYHDPYQFLIPA